MVGGKRRSHRFLCFRVGADAVIGDDEETEPGSDRSGGDINCKASRRCRRRLLPRVFSRLLRSRSAEDGSKKQLDIRSLSSESPLSGKSLESPLSAKSLPRLPGSLPNDDDSRISEPIFSSSSSSSSTSSSLSSVSSLGSSVSMSPIMMPTIHQKKLPTRTESRKLVSPPARRKYNATTGLCILLVSLSVLVFSGKLCAILWTSTCLCLTPRRRGGGKPLGGVPPEVRRLGSLEGDKKRIVLEGFLDRNRKG